MEVKVRSRCAMTRDLLAADLEQSIHMVVSLIRDLVILCNIPTIFEAWNMIKTSSRRSLDHALIICLIKF